MLVANLYIYMNHSYPTFGSVNIFFPNKCHAEKSNVFSLNMSKRADFFDCMNNRLKEKKKRREEKEERRNGREEGRIRCDREADARCRNRTSTLPRSRRTPVSRESY